MPRTLAYEASFRRKRRRLSAAVADRCPESDRALVLQKWLAICEVNMACSSTGAQILKVQQDDEAEQQVFDLLSDVLASKATSTLAVRSTAILLYVRWFSARGGCARPALPIDEDDLYEYVSSLRKDKAPASRASSLLEAWNFAVHVVGFGDPSEAAQSLRCKGSAHRQLARRRPRKRAKVLVMEMVAALEMAAVFTRNTFRRCAAGYACLCLFGRLRCDDGSCIAGIEIDGNILEGCLLGTKTSKSKEKKATFLPALVPLSGLTGLDWWSCFEESREVLGLEAMPTLEEAGELSVDDDKTLLLPAFKKGEFMHKVPMSSEELTAVVVDALETAGFEDKFLGGISSHSLKATWLTALGKFGTPQGARQLLGYHVAKGESSALNYNRDNLAHPLELFLEVIEKVKRGEFVPDEKRGSMRPIDPSSVEGPVSRLETVLGLDRFGIAERFAKGALSERETQLCRDAGRHELFASIRSTQAETPEVLEGEGIEPPSGEESQGMSGSESSDSARESDGFGEEVEDGDEQHELALKVAGAVDVTEGDVPTAKAKFADPSSVWKHQTRRTVHYGHLEKPDKLACGKACLQEVYEQIPPEEGVPWPRCADCFSL